MLAVAFYASFPPAIEKALRKRRSLTDEQVRAVVDRLPEAVRRIVERETIETLCMMMHDVGMSDSAIWLERVTSVEHPGDGR